MENKVEVVRYIRPTDYLIIDFKDWNTYLQDNLYGVTLLFTIDYDTGVVETNWSVCNGDNFSRKIGKEIARKNNQKFQFPLEMVEKYKGLKEAFLESFFIDVCKFPDDFEGIMKLLIKTSGKLQNEKSS